VAAILKFFPRGRSRLTIWTRPRWRPSGGCARGVSAERFETPLVGGAAAPMRASAFCWRAACQRLGGNPPAPAFPQRGKRERGSSDFLAAAGTSRWRSENARHAAGLLCARSSSTFLSITITKPIGQSRSFRFLRSLAGATHSFAVLLSALSLGRTGPGASWGPILSPGPSPRVTNLGCWVLPSVKRSFEGSCRYTQSPEQGGGCLY
jgi:hypothetical protein